MSSSSSSPSCPSSLKTSIAGIVLETCVYNASGPRTGSAAALAKITASQSGAVLAKSATVESQTGNPLPRVWHSPDGEASMNSEGLPNSGIDYYLDPATFQEAMGDHPNKPYMISVSGKTLDDNIKMIQKAIHCKHVSIIELNLACPNIIGKPIIAYDFDQMKSVLQKISNIKNLPKIGVKLPPYFDGPHFKQAADVLNRFKHTIGYVASINTIGNALAIDSLAETPTISSKGGFAGLSGRPVKYTALANVRQMRLLLDPSIDVVAAGGVHTGTDVFEFILCGAAAVQVGTCHWKEGAGCFNRICEELKLIMEQKGYTTIEQFKGQLKEWSKEGAAKSRAAKKALQQKQAANKEKESEQIRAGPELANVINAILMVVIAILLADKYGVVDVL